MAKRTGTDKADKLTGTAKADELYGGGGSDVLSGLGGNDYLDGGAGDDDLRGGAGNDTYIVDNANDIDRKLIDPGTDLVVAFVNYTLGTQQEKLLLYGKTALNGVGNNLANTMTGNDGANVLSGLGGTDTLDGGKGIDDLRGGNGNDLYIIDNAREINKTFADAGKDQVRSVVSYALGNFQEELILIGSGAISGTGNSGVNFIQGNDKANTLRGLDGADTLDGGKGNDVLYGGNGDDDLGGGDGNDVLNGGAGKDRLYGGAGIDVLNGDDGDDTLQGDAGVDILSGGNGNDIYVLDGSLFLGVAKDTAADIAIGADPGDDTVAANFDFALELNSGQENITLYGNAALRAQGNDFANQLVARTAQAGDELLGLGGNDFLDGGVGDDHLVGGDGNDTYRVDHLGDISAADVDDGIDTVESTISYTLFNNQENLTLLNAAAAVNGTGNGGGNVIFGNTFANVLSGLGGNDQLIGGGGADHLLGGEGSDILHYSASAVEIDGGGGFDALYIVGVGVANVDVDLTGVAGSIVKDIEVVLFASNDDAINQSHSITLGINDVLAMSSTTDILKVIGEADDTVHLNGAGWTKNAVSGEVGFQDYHNGSAVVRIDTHILESHVIFT